MFPGYSHHVGTCHSGILLATWTKVDESGRKWMKVDESGYMRTKVEGSKIWSGEELTDPNICDLKLSEAIASI